MKRSGIPAIPATALVTHYSSLLFPPFGRVTFFVRPKNDHQKKGAPRERRLRRSFACSPCGGRRVNSRCALGQYAPLFRRLGCAAQPLPMGNCRPMAVIARSEATKQSRGRLAVSRRRTPTTASPLIVGVRVPPTPTLQLVIVALLFPPFGRGTFFCLPKRKCPKKRAPA